MAMTAVLSMHPLDISFPHFEQTPAGTTPGLPSHLTLEYSAFDA